MRLPSGRELTSTPTDRNPSRTGMDMTITFTSLIWWIQLRVGSKRANFMDLRRRTDVSKSLIQYSCLAIRKRRKLETIMEASSKEFSRNCAKYGIDTRNRKYIEPATELDIGTHTSRSDKRFASIHSQKRRY